MTAARPIRVLFFSVVRDAVGGLDELPVVLGTDLAESATLRELLDWLEGRFPALAGWRDRLLLAVNLEFASPDQKLEPGQEVALMPPVQGG